MIPKIIHFCWFGGKPKPKFFLKYLKTWERILNDYEFIEWNETNFEVNSNIFTKQAYDNNKFAFVSDYVRLYALFQHGGIYLDTDVEVIKNFDVFLYKNAFIGFEGDSHIGTAVIGAEKNNIIIGAFLEYYQNKKFILENGVYDQTPNTHILADILTEKGLVFNDTYQVLENSFEIFPKHFFSAKSFLTGELIKTSETVSIHHFACTWLPWYLRLWVNFCYFAKGIHRVFQKTIKR